MEVSKERERERTGTRGVKGASGGGGGAGSQRCLQGERSYTRAAPPWVINATGKDEVISIRVQRRGANLKL